MAAHVELCTTYILAGQQVLSGNYRPQTRQSPSATAASIALADRAPPRDRVTASAAFLVRLV